MTCWIVWIMLVIASAACNVLHAQEASSAAAPGERRNWYNDPFFTLSHAIADCPVPLGPMMTHAQMEDDAHYRVERGTTCWLAHKCTKPNSYMYDADIASAIHARFVNPHAFDGTSVWITVQRRFVYAEGCAPASFDRHALQQQLEAIPDVEQVFMRIAASTHGPMPYKTLAEPDRQPITEPTTEPVTEPVTEPKPQTQ